MPPLETSMAKRKKKPPSVYSKESRPAEMFTVAWMLSVMTALLCEVASVLIGLVRDDRGLAATFSGYLMFAALIVGVISLLLLPAVFKLRRVPPPRGITVFAVVVGAAPIVLLLLAQLR